MHFCLLFRDKNKRATGIVHAYQLQGLQLKLGENKMGHIAGTAERILKWGGGAENERRRRELVGGSGGILPPKILKSRVSEIVFTAFSARYFLK